MEGNKQLKDQKRGRVKMLSFHGGLVLLDVFGLVVCHMLIRIRSIEERDMSIVVLVGG